MQTPPRKGFWLSRRSRELTPGLCSILAEEAISRVETQWCKPEHCNSKKQTIPLGHPVAGAKRRIEI